MRRFWLCLLVGGCSTPADPLPIRGDAGAATDAAAAPDAQPAADAGPAVFSGAATVSWTLQSEGTGTSYVEALVIDSQDHAVVYGAFDGLLRAGELEIRADERPSSGGYWLRANQNGRVLGLRRVIEGRMANAALTVLFGDDVLLLGTLESGVLGPDDGAPIVFAPGDWSLILARLDQDGRVRWGRRARGNVSQIAASPGLDGHILIYGSFYEFVELEAANGTLRLSTRDQGQYPGHGFWVELDAEGRALRGAVIEGTAGSSINKMVAQSDGTLIFSGAFGFFPRGATAIFQSGEPDEVVLESVSSDDDPAFDTFLGAYEADGRLRWAQMIRAYGWERGGSELVVIDGKPLISVAVAGYPIGFADGSPEAVQIETPAALARYDENGRLEWARGSPRIDRIHQVNGLLQGASAVADLWLANQGEPDELRIERTIEPGAQRFVLSRFDTTGHALAASLLEIQNDPDQGAPRMGTMIPGANGRSWVIAGDPSEELTVGGVRITPPSQHQRLVLVRVIAP